MYEFIHNNIKLIVYDNGRVEAVNKNIEVKPDKNVPNRPNFDISLPGIRHLRPEPNGFVFEGIDEYEDGIGITYRAEKHGLEVCCDFRFVKGADVIVQTNHARNISGHEIRLTRFSSAVMDNIASDSVWYKNDDLKIHICRSSWQGECQWREYSPSELGVYPCTSHSWESKSYRITSIGSQSTAEFYPLVMAEDRAGGYIWYMETEGSHSWKIELTARGGYAEPSLSLEAVSADEDVGNWYYDLKPGETYSAERCFWGVTEGGFENAVEQLNIFKRLDSNVKHKNNIPPVVFNDYMDCVWVDQSPKTIFPLIDKAAEVGCEIFVIDDGWSENANGIGKGDWQVKKSIYSKADLKDIADRIIERGMIPGLWFELESVNDTAAGAGLNDNALIKLYGMPVGDRGVYFYNMTDPEVRKYLKERIREFYDIGYRFIKNDYNQSIGIGCTNTYDGESPAQGLIENTNAFYGFIEELYKEFPGLIIENCGSGAMRDDNKVLRNFAFQSVSDQEFYYNNPAIVMGSMAVMPPEKAGIWSYPYPAMLSEYKNFRPGKEYTEKMADGRQTVFNMVTAMLGVLYQSGRIDLCDDKNTYYIRRGIEIYKQVREYIPKSRPVYPMGMHNINTEGIAALGLLSENKLILAVWNIMSSDERASLDISKYIGLFAHIETLYCADGEKCSLENGIINAEMSGMSAVFAVISF